MAIACKFLRLPTSSTTPYSQRRFFATAATEPAATAAPALGAPIRQTRAEKAVFSATRPQYFSAVKLEGAILIKHPLPENAPPVHPRIPEDDKKSASEALRLSLKPDEIEEVKRLRFNDPFGWSQAALARHFHTTGEVIGKIIRIPETKKKSVKELYVPQRRDTVARRRWTASMRIKKGLPPLEQPLPEPKILPRKKTARTLL